jgi:hypothetical protein
MTPIQKLIDLLKECLAAYERGTTSHDALNIAISFVKLNLQLERQAIENAYNAGYSEGCNTIDPEGRKYKNAEGYYNQTFNQK